MSDKYQTESLASDDGGELDTEGSPQLTKKPKKPPTGEQLRNIKDAANLYRSNTFKLQIDALLPHVRPNLSRRPPLDRFLLALHSFLMSIPSVPPEHPLLAARKLSNKGVAVPYSLPFPTESTNWKVAFEKPAGITLVGSWANDISVKGKDAAKFGVDLAIEMPQSLFQEKDYLNGRFFHKKAFYLAVIADAIQSSKDRLNVEISYDCTSNDPRLTTLVLWPVKNKSGDDFTTLNACVHILPVLPSPSPIPLSRLSPTQSNIRLSPSDGSSPTHFTPTPLYNTALLKTLTPKSGLLSTHTLKQVAPAFCDALTLLRIWANQRGYGEGIKLCVRGFQKCGPWWSALLALLIDGEEDRKGTRAKRLGRGLSSYQLFRAALDFLAKHDFENDHVYLKTQDGHRFQPDEYQGQHDAIFVDSSSTINLLARIPLCSLEMLSHDAKKSLEILDTLEPRDPFTEIFLKDKRDICTRFDTVIRVDLSAAKQQNPSLQLTLDHGSPTEGLLASLASHLRHGLGNRTKAIAILHPSSAPWPVSKPHPPGPSIVHIGLVYDQEHAFRLVDHGPAAGDANQHAAEQFREFWGDKAELRRFKDGRITESVVWDVKTSDERTHVPSFIVRHILGRHFGIADEAIKTWQTFFDSALKLPQMISRQVPVTATVAGFKGALTAFDDLVKAIKALGDLPLAILNVSASSEYLRYTSVFTPIPPPAAGYMPLMEIVLEFEKSSKWPDDLTAIQKVKLAFLEHIATALMASVAGLKAAVVVGDGICKSEIQDQARLEIVTPPGWAFSTRIWHDREATLLDRILENNAPILPHVKRVVQTDGKEYQQASEAREVYTRRFIHAPRHHRAIASLSHQFSAYAGTVRLVKRWLASHWLLCGHISEEAVEILCAFFFVGDRKASSEIGLANVPGSKERGFATVVEFLMGWKWVDGLYVPLYGSAGSDGGASDTPEMRQMFNTHSSVWTISTEADKDGHVWTSRGPDITAAYRVRALAKATWEHMREMESGLLDVRALFVHPTEDYDFIIQLDSAVLPRYYQNITVSLDALFDREQPLKGWFGGDKRMSSRPGFDPAQLFFDDLQFIYTDTLKIFYDPFGGDRIGAVWDPALKTPRSFKVLSRFSGIPCGQENDKLVILNESAVLSEIKRMGTGMVKRILVQKRME